MKQTVLASKMWAGWSRIKKTNKQKTSKIMYAAWPVWL
jgi:hypothetical protein